VTTWREATLEDYAGILKCHHTLEQKMGMELDLPKFSNPAVLAWLVAERNGEIVQFVVIERLVEARMGGCDREALQELMKQAPKIMADTRRAGIRFLHMCVPPQVEKQVARKLKKVKIFKSPNSLYCADLR